MADQPAEFSIDDVFADAKLPKQSVPMCLRGDLVAAWQDFERRFKQANTADEDSLASATSAEAVDLARQMSDLQEQMRASTRVFQLQGLPRSEWRELLKAHPARDEDQTDFNAETFPVAALAACSVVPKMTLAQAEKLVDMLTDGQWNVLFSHVWMLNAGQVEIPFSLAASAILAVSAPKPK
jgi:hypothetical protein